ncbi:MAG: hypothetical protein JHC89_10295 [Acetobacteraceae bacterium]|nr:hypothetical protein [Acetobacteraceae bacterium]
MKGVLWYIGALRNYEAMKYDAGGYTPIIQIMNEIHKAKDAGATTAALAMVYIGIDTMAFLACAIGQQKQDRADFIAWVDRYLKADIASEYQYEGLDVYAGRCAFLHTYGSISDLHRKEKPPRIFGYTDTGRHRKSDADGLVLISIAFLVHDFRAAIKMFLGEASQNADLKQKIDSRIGSLHFTSRIEG